MLLKWCGGNQGQWSLFQPCGCSLKFIIDIFLWYVNPTYVIISFYTLNWTGHLEHLGVKKCNEASCALEGNGQVNHRHLALLGMSNYGARQPRLIRGRVRVMFWESHLLPQSWNVILFSKFGTWTRALNGYDIHNTHHQLQEAKISCKAVKCWNNVLMSL